MKIESFWQYRRSIREHEMVDLFYVEMGVFEFPFPVNFHHENLFFGSNAVLASLCWITRASNPNMS